jgi:hypothetical protein
MESNVVTKLFEIRDRATFMPMMAVRLVPTVQDADTFDRELWILRRAGYAVLQLQAEPDGCLPYVILCKLDGVQAHYDPFDWDNSRTREVHDYIIKNWWDLHSGAVIDIEYILGETTEPKVSEQVTHG